MDRLELYVRETRPDQRRKIAVLVQPPFQCAERDRHLLWRRGHEAGVARPASPDPILRAADFTGLHILASYTRHQDAVRLAQEADAERKPLGICDSRAGVGERVHIVAEQLGDSHFLSPTRPVLERGPARTDR